MFLGGLLLQRECKKRGCAEKYGLQCSLIYQTQSVLVKWHPKNHYSTPSRSHILQDQTIYLRIFLRTEYQWIMPLRVTNKQKEFEVVFFSEECKSSALRSLLFFLFDRPFYAGCSANPQL